MRRREELRDGFSVGGVEASGWLIGGQNGGTEGERTSASNALRRPSVHAAIRQPKGLNAAYQNFYVEVNAVLSLSLRILVRAGSSRFRAEGRMRHRKRVLISGEGGNTRTAAEDPKKPVV